MWPFSSSSPSSRVEEIQEKVNDLTQHLEEDLCAAAIRAKSLPEIIAASPAAVGILSASGTIFAVAVYWRYFRRIRNAEYLTPGVLKWRKTLVGRVTSVGDADGFRLYHTPGPPFLRRLLFPIPSTPAALRDNTLSIRLAGADAPESAHFGNQAQPFSKEARDRLTALVADKTVWVEVSHVDQYKRLVATPLVFAPPYIFGRTNVSFTLVKEGLATVYTQSGAAYGNPTFWARIWSKEANGKARLLKAEENARSARRGMWSLGTKLETPEAYKKRTRA